MHDDTADRSVIIATALLTNARREVRARRRRVRTGAAAAVVAALLAPTVAIGGSTLEGAERVVAIVALALVGVLGLVRAVWFARSGTALLALHAALVPALLPRLGRDAVATLAVKGGATAAPYLISAVAYGDHLQVLAVDLAAHPDYVPPREWYLATGGNGL